MLDNTYSITTPELITLKLKPAGIVPRFIAWSIDLFIQFIILSILMLVLNILYVFLSAPSGLLLGTMFIVFFTVIWFYSALFEAWNKGRTPGKLMVGIHVVKDNGTPITMGAAVIRSLMRYADFTPAFYGLGILSMMLTPNRQRTGDIIAGTIVCYQEEKQHWHKIPYVAPIQPPMQLSVDTQQMIINFAERTHIISRARQEELASNLPALAFSDNKEEPQGAARLVGIANFLIGREHL